MLLIKQFNDLMSKRQVRVIAHEPYLVERPSISD